MERQSKILVVDDDQFTLQSMAKVLEGESYQVVAVASGSEALDLLKQDSFDLVLTDLKMPEVDGLEVLRRASEIAPQAVVLILTGYASVESAIEALREGAYDYLVKPCSDHDLKLKIERGLERVRLVEERKRAEEELRKAHDDLERRVEERTAELAEVNKALQAEIAERKRAEEQIKASLGEKEVLLKEIHHRVKNNLQVVSSMLQLQSRNVKDKETVEIFQESRNRIRSMALAHERLYQSKDLARVDFAKYIRSLASYLGRSYGVNTNVIQLKTNLQDVFLGVDTAIPCGLILNELVSNCLKHAFPDGREGEICIELRSDSDGEFTLVVSDNGIGLPEDLDFRNTESLGLQLVNTLVNQLEGTIELDRRGGTAFEITFTEMKYKERQ